MIWSNLWIRSQSILTSAAYYLNQLQVLHRIEPNNSSVNQASLDLESSFPGSGLGWKLQFQEPLVNAPLPDDTRVDTEITVPGTEFLASQSENSLTGVLSISEDVLAMQHFEEIKTKQLEKIKTK